MHFECTHWCSTYQWMVTLYRALLTTFTTRVSPLFTSNVGPGNCPLTVMVLWVLHNLFTGVDWTYQAKPSLSTENYIHMQVKKMIPNTKLRHTTKSWWWVLGFALAKKNKKLRNMKECNRLAMLLIVSMVFFDFTENDDDFGRSD